MGLHSPLRSSPIQETVASGKAAEKKSHVKKKRRKSRTRVIPASLRRRSRKSSSNGSVVTVKPETPSGSRSSSSGLSPSTEIISSRKEATNDKRTSVVSDKTASAATAHASQSHQAAALASASRVKRDNERFEHGSKKRSLFQEAVADTWNPGSGKIRNLPLHPAEETRPSPETSKPQSGDSSTERPLDPPLQTNSTQKQLMTALAPVNAVASHSHPNAAPLLPVAKKRGRPKGSKNKPKLKALSTTGSAVAGVLANDSSRQLVSQDPSTREGQMESIVQETVAKAETSVSRADGVIGTNAQLPVKKKRGRPKGTKNKPITSASSGSALLLKPVFATAASHQSTPNAINSQVTTMKASAQAKETVAKAEAPGNRTDTGLVTNILQPTKKKRGRPKGSKNKPKTNNSSASDSAGSGMQKSATNSRHQPTPIAFETQDSAMKSIPQARETAAKSEAPGSRIDSGLITNMQPPAKKKRGRPKGSKNKPNANNSSTSDSAVPVVAKSSKGASHPLTRDVFDTQDTMMKSSARASETAAKVETPGNETDSELLANEQSKRAGRLEGTVDEPKTNASSKSDSTVAGGPKSANDASHRLTADHPDTQDNIMRHSQGNCAVAEEGISNKNRTNSGPDANTLSPLSKECAQALGNSENKQPKKTVPVSATANHQRQRSKKRTRQARAVCIEPSLPPLSGAQGETKGQTKTSKILFEDFKEAPSASQPANMTEEGLARPVSCGKCIVCIVTSNFGICQNASRFNREETSALTDGMQLPLLNPPPQVRRQRKSAPQGNNNDVADAAESTAVATTEWVNTVEEASAGSEPPPKKRKRGRPKGSKNKPKPSQVTGEIDNPDKAPRTFGKKAGRWEQRMGREETTKASVEINEQQQKIGNSVDKAKVEPEENGEHDPTKTNKRELQEPFIALPVDETKNTHLLNSVELENRVDNMEAAVGVQKAEEIDVEWHTPRRKIDFDASMSEDSFVVGATNRRPGFPNASKDDPNSSLSESAAARVHWSDKEATYPASEDVAWGSNLGVRKEITSLQQLRSSGDPEAASEALESTEFNQELPNLRMVGNVVAPELKQRPKGSKDKLKAQISVLESPELEIAGKEPVVEALLAAEGGDSVPVTKRRLGRPKGSKNKPKAAATVDKVSKKAPGVEALLAAEGGDSAPVTKRRLGRPKGSKNKPKAAPTVDKVSKKAPDVEALLAAEGGDSVPVTKRRLGRPKGSKNKPKAAPIVDKVSKKAPGVEALLAAEGGDSVPVTKRRLGRPKGSKNKQKTSSDDETFKKEPDAEELPDTDEGYFPAVSIQNLKALITKSGSTEQSIIMKDPVGKDLTEGGGSPSTKRRPGRPEGSENKPKVLSGGFTLEDVQVASSDVVRDVDDIAGSILQIPTKRKLVRPNGIKIRQKAEVAMGFKEALEYVEGELQIPRRKWERKRCGRCLACSVKTNCGKCRHCLDMPEFGGKGLVGKRCILRMCLMSFSKDTSKTSTSKVSLRRNTNGPSSDSSEIQSLNDHHSIGADDWSDMEWDDAPSSPKSSLSTMAPDDCQKQSQKAGTQEEVIVSLPIGCELETVPVTVSTLTRKLADDSQHFHDDSARFSDESSESLELPPQADLF